LIQGSGLDGPTSQVAVVQRWVGLRLYTWNITQPYFLWLRPGLHSYWTAV